MLLFGVPIFKFKCKNHNEIKELVCGNLESYSTPKPWDCTVQSSFLKKLDWLENSKYLYTSDVKKLALQYDADTVDYRVNDIWINVYKKNHFQEYHNHCPSDFSAIHFVQFDEEHAGPIFKDPNEALSTYNSYMRFKNSIEYQVPVEEGDIIFFPSFLEHKVPKNKTDSKRITISFNLNMGPKNV